jgi:hypothetical protein
MYRFPTNGISREIPFDALLKVFFINKAPNGFLSCGQTLGPSGAVVKIARQQVFHPDQPNHSSFY